ncbi:MAG: tyrosine-type recombinase/integrase [Planctomycetota bacterium]|jgi:integrase
MAKRSRRYFGSVITRPGRPGYYIRIRGEGKQLTRYAGTSKDRALNNLARIWKRVRRGAEMDVAIAQVLGRSRCTPGSQPPSTSLERPRFAEVAERYLKSVTIEKRASTLREDRVRLDVILRARWTRKPIDDIGKGDIARWIDDLGAAGNDGQGLAPSTLNRYRSLVSVVFQYAVDRDLIEENPARNLKRANEIDRAREEYLTLDELLALLEHCPEELWLMILTAVTTGVRQGVLRQLRWSDVDLDAGTMLVKASYAKGKKPQLFHLVPQVVQGLRTLWAAIKVKHFRGDDAVFRTKTGRPWTRSWLCHLVRSVVDTCPGIPEEKRRKVSFHTLRHSFASLLSMDGISSRKLQEALAHSDPKLTARYSHLSSEAMREIRQRVAHLLDPDGSDRVRENPGIPKGYQAASGA